MDIKEILSKVDHTLLAVDATWDQIKVICDDAVKYQTASVCIPAVYVKRASEYIKEEAAEQHLSCEQKERACRPYCPQVLWQSM